MTGYGHALSRTEDFTIEIVVKSYNNRYLDIIKNMSTPLAPFEGIVDEAVRKVAARGHVEVSAKLRVLRSSAKINVDEGLLDEYMRAFSIIEGRTGRSAAGWYRTTSRTTTFTPRLWTEGHSTDW